MLSSGGIDRAAGGRLRAARRVRTPGAAFSLVRDVQHIRDLAPDPRNARRHTPRNVGMIEAALREVGAARSIVVDEDGTILAGNATADAAAAAGIERVQIIDADGETLIAVRRSGLTPEQKAKLALYDNRAAELAEWEPAALADLVEEIDLSGLFRDDEIAVLLTGAGDGFLADALAAGAGGSPWPGDDAASPGENTMTIQVLQNERDVIMRAVRLIRARDDRVATTTEALVAICEDWLCRHAS